MCPLLLPDPLSQYLMMMVASFIYYYAHQYHLYKLFVSVLTFSFDPSSYEVREDVEDATLNVTLSGHLGIFDAHVNVTTDETSTLTSARGLYASIHSKSLKTAELRTLHHKVT